MAPLQKRIHFWLVGWLGAWLLRALYRSWRVHVVDPDGVQAGMRDGSRPAMIVFWHRDLLTVLAHHRGHKMFGPVSRSRDGEMVAHVMERFGGRSVRGSTSRGSIELVRGMLNEMAQGWSPGITPDGPRGPRFSVQPGVAVLARRSRFPVYPIGVAVRRAWIWPSWDLLRIPKPWTQVAIVYGEPMKPEEFLDVPQACRRLRENLFKVEEMACRALERQVEESRLRDAQ